MRRRGLYPRCTDCIASENAPEITAWLAITVATVDTPTIGYRAQSGAIR